MMTKSDDRTGRAPSGPNRAPRPAAVIEQSPRRGRWLGTPGWNALVVGAVFLGIQINGPAWSGTALLVAGLVLVVVGLWAVLRGQRHLTRVLPGLRDLPGDERIVLFLRAFSDESGFARVAGLRLRRLLLWPMMSMPGDTRTEEEQVARAVAPFGHMVALGQPSDRLPRSGADRSYASDEAWQAEVLAALDRADLVLLAAGPGQSLMWEVDQVVRRNDPTRLVVVVSRNQRQYAEFRESVGNLFPKRLPDYPVARVRQRIFRGRYVRAVIWFDGDWTPHLEMLDGRFPLINSAYRTQRALPRALQQLYLRFGVPVRSRHATADPRPRPWAVKVSVTALISFWLSIVALCVFAVVSVANFTIILDDLEKFGTSLYKEMGTFGSGFSSEGGYSKTEALPAAVDSLILGALILLPLVGIITWLFRIWRGGPYAIAMARIYGMLVGVLLLAAMVALVLTLFQHASTLLFGLVLLLFSGLALLVSGVLCLPVAALLLTRHDVRRWVESRE